MASKFTSINREASTSGVAVARAGAQSQGPMTTGPIDRAVRVRRKCATDADPRIMEKHIRNLKLERARQGENFRWPEGLTAGNAVVAGIEESGVPVALSCKKNSRDSATLDFVLCAKQNSHWSHGKIAACIGRSEQATRLILYHAKREKQKRQLAAQAGAQANDGQAADQAARQALEQRTARAAERHAAQIAAAQEATEQATAEKAAAAQVAAAQEATEQATAEQEAAEQEAAEQRTAQDAAAQAATQNAVPAPTPSSSVGQLNRPELLHPPTQTSLEAQSAAARGRDLSSYRVFDPPGPSQCSDEVRGKIALWRPGSNTDAASSNDVQDMTGMEALVAASDIRARQPERKLPPLDAGIQALPLPGLAAMGLM